MTTPELTDWLRTSLAPLDCTGQGVLDNGQLRLLVEGATVPPVTQTMTCLRENLPRLREMDIRSLLVFGRVRGEEIPRWAETLTVTPAMRGQSVQERLARLRETLQQQSQIGQRVREQIDTLRPQTIPPQRFQSPTQTVATAEIRHRLQQGERNFSQANLSGVDLSELNLRETCFRGADLSQANLQGCDLTDADLSQANLRGANLTGTRLVRANLNRAILASEPRSITNLRQADARLAQFTEATLSRVMATGANFAGADLSRADLSRADLSQTNLTEAKLVQADLSRANLSGAYLADANLSQANLTAADLTWSNLLRTNLERADLSEASLNHAQMQGTYLRDTIFKGTIMPNGVVTYAAPPSS
ncbi:MAG: pentapeptide repeat-containing protein [Gloeomargarita sp. SKYBB_i_bin120]|nr:pentapeptide repeat-containing protein [Gloeomargarita sp. SKYG98]MCS7292015.1 pentapeptide repeat-containing protein [Gloeomargarita sp. SKYB120]MDW8177575.1 pentapeptide repeat-containing protein [Gloeomargarita sp. SKYBB_i_bin120]